MPRSLFLTQTNLTLNQDGFPFPKGSLTEGTHLFNEHLILFVGKYWENPDALKEIETVSDVYLHVTAQPIQETMQLIKRLNELGKSITMVTCNCGESIKGEQVRIFQIKAIWTDGCSGYTTCPKIIASLAAGQDPISSTPQPTL